MERRIDLSFHFCPFSIVLLRHNWSSYSNRYFSLLKFIVGCSLVFWVPNSKPTSLFCKFAHYLYLKDLLCKGCSFQKLDSTFFQGPLSSSPPPPPCHNALLKKSLCALLFKNKIRHLIFSAQTSILFSISLYSLTRCIVCHSGSWTVTV